VYLLEFINIYIICMQVFIFIARWKNRKKVEKVKRKKYEKDARKYFYICHLVSRLNYEL